MPIGGTVDLTLPVVETAIYEFVVNGNAMPRVGTMVGETNLQIFGAEIEQLPMQRNVESVALPAPGTDAGGYGGA